ncbi:MAG: hypothetical protein IPG92_11995 [Flavobacteriales bacterium]|nr:hypothetical protein [Flavobacteriales bacterium]
MAITSSTFAQQGISNLWMGGYGNGAPPPWGAVDLDFIYGSLVVSTPTRTIDFGRTNANITSANGHLLFSTNGAFVANALGNTMLNGAGLNPSDYTYAWANYGLHISQACLILPKPDAPDIYYLFHGTIDDQQTSTANYLYLTTIDMSQDGGLGGVVTKNQVLINDTLNAGGITAVRHANGRDWRSSATR